MIGADSMSGSISGPRASRSSPPIQPGKLGPFDATMLVMGGIVGAGIFINPYVVARLVASPGAILLAWAIGGAIALLGAFVYAELAARLPEALDRRALPRRLPAVGPCLECPRPGYGAARGHASHLCE
jgi:hypothetical protein